MYFKYYDITYMHYSPAVTKVNAHLVGRAQGVSRRGIGA